MVRWFGGLGFGGLGFSGSGFRVCLHRLQI